MAAEATPIEPQSLVGSPEHQSLLDRFEQLFTGAWEYVQQHLPEHTLKPTVLNNLKQAYDNTAAIVKADLAATVGKLEEQAKTAEQTAMQGAESAGEAAVAGVEEAAQAVTPTSTSSAPPAAPGAVTGTASSSDASGATEAPPTA